MLKKILFIAITAISCGCSNNIQLQVDSGVPEAKFSETDIQQLNELTNPVTTHLFWLAKLDKPVKKNSIVNIKFDNVDITLDHFVEAMEINAKTAGVVFCVRDTENETIDLEFCGTSMYGKIIKDDRYFEFHTLKESIIIIERVWSPPQLKPYPCIMPPLGIDRP